MKIKTTKTKVLKKNICKPSLLKKILSHAYYSLYKMNAQTADCYMFSIDEDGKDWSGGWDWSQDLICDYFDYMLMLDSKKVYKIKQI